MTTETHYFDGKKENNVVQTKLELFKEGRTTLGDLGLLFGIKSLSVNSLLMVGFLQ